MNCCKGVDQNNNDKTETFYISTASRDSFLQMDEYNLPLGETLNVVSFMPVHTRFSRIFSPKTDPLLSFHYSSRVTLRGHLAAAELLQESQSWTNCKKTGVL